MYIIERERNLFESERSLFSKEMKYRFNSVIFLFLELLIMMVFLTHFLEEFQQAKTPRECVISQEKTQKVTRLLVHATIFKPTLYAQ